MEFPMHRSRLRIARPALLLGLLLSPLAASAMDITVTKTTDSLDGACDSDCSLREAVVLANATPGAHRIRLGTGTYTLTLPTPRGDEGVVLDEDENLNGDLDLAAELEVVGASSDLTHIDGSRNDRIFEVMSGAKLTLRRLSLHNGFTSDYGAAVENFGQLLVRQVHMYDNRAFASFNGGGGGAIANQGTLAVYSSQFERNSADFGDSGRALGGALFNAGALLVRDSLFRDNETNGDDVVAWGGALFNAGTADVARSAFLGGHVSDGPGIVIRNDGNGVLKLTNSTLSGENRSYERPEDSSVVANGDYYPLYAGTPSMLLINVTIAGNPSLGLSNHGNLTIRNSLVSGNGNEFIGIQNCRNDGTFTYQARGLLLGSDTNNCTADLYVDNAITFTRVLYPLADNNSTLPTHALRKGSPAVDAGVGSCTSHDQRGLTRPRDGDGDGVAICDLGAYERAKP